MNETLPHRSRKIRAVLAGFLVLGIGIITTVAVWNDDIFGTGDFEAGGFALEGSIDGGTVWDDYGAAGEAAVLFNQDNLQLVTSYYKEFWVRIKAGEKAVNNIEVSLPSVTRGSGGNENYLDYEIFNITAAGSCAEGALGAAPKIWSGNIGAESVVVDGTLPELVGLDTLPSAPVKLCFVVTTTSQLQAMLPASGTWKLLGTEKSS